MDKPKSEMVKLKADRDGEQAKSSVDQQIHDALVPTLQAEQESLGAEQTFLVQRQALLQKRSQDIDTVLGKLRGT